jgi:hypothetical protein
MNRRRWIARLLSAAPALSLVLVNTVAHAYNDQSAEFSDSDYSGNDNISASFSWWGQSSNTTTTTAAIGFDRNVDARQQFTINAQVKGHWVYPLWAWSEGNTWQNWASNVPYLRTARGSVEFFGQTVFNQSLSNVACSGDANATCISYSQGISKSVDLPPATFSVGVISVELTAGVSAGMNAELSAGARATPYLGRQQSLFARTSSDLSASAYASAYATATAGIPWVAAANAEIDFKLIDVSISPKMTAYQVAWNSNGTTKGSRGYDDAENVYINTMSGNVTVGFSLIGGLISDSWEMISWPGYSWGPAVWANGKADETL